MDPLDSTMQAVRRVAALPGAGAGDLLKLLREKYLVPRVQKLGTMSEALALYDAMGPVEFRTALAQLDSKKATALLKKLDKHASESTLDVVGHITQLAAGTAKPTSPPPRAPARAKLANNVVLPDVRSVYREEGMAAVAAKLAALSLTNLKAVVAEQKLVASISSGKGAPGFRKFIQVAIQEELGPRTDVFATIASLPDSDA
jgi:hypothetical protein